MLIVEETTLPEFRIIFTTTYHVAFKIFGKKVIIQSGVKSYFKVGQALFQSWAIISKWGKSYFKVGHLLQNGAKRYFKVRQLLQYGEVISMYGITQLQTRTSMHEFQK